MEPDTTAFEEAKAEESLSDSFLDRLHALMRHENVETVLSLQTDMLASLEVSNEKLRSLNIISERKFQAVAGSFRQHSKNLLATKKELDSVFRRIRSLKMRLALQFPDEYSAAASQQHVDEADLEP